MMHIGSLTFTIIPDLNLIPYQDSFADDSSQVYAENGNTVVSGESTVEGDDDNTSSTSVHAVLGGPSSATPLDPATSQQRRVSEGKDEAPTCLSPSSNPMSLIPPIAPRDFSTDLNQHLNHIDVGNTLSLGTIESVGRSQDSTTRVESREVLRHHDDSGIRFGPVVTVIDVPPAYTQI